MALLDPGQFYSVWPLVLCLLAAFAAARLPVFRMVDAPHRPAGRARAIDGLRAFLAVGVVISHGGTYRAFLLGGEWGRDMSPFYAACGTIAVAMFFMITGFLFWGRLIRDGGRPDWAALYVGRAFRIAPLYLAAVLALLAYVATATGGLTVAPGELLRQVAPWFALGAVEGGDINGYPDTSLILAGVTWTLRWEWYFYASLAVTALAARRPGRHLPFALAVLVGAAGSTLLVPHRASVFVLLFSIGMACASARAAGYKLRAPQPVLSAAVLALIACCATLIPGGYTSKSAVLLGCAFYLIAVAECTVFGALASRAAARLGEVSYGIYLLHGLVFAVVLRTDLGRSAAAASPGFYWLLVAGCLLLVLGLALLAHVAVEKPGIALGHRLMAWLRRPGGPERRAAHRAQTSRPATVPALNVALSGAIRD